MERQSTTFILMKIIRDLNHNTNTEAREQQRRFVNERFQRSNTNIDRCIKSSSTDLTELITNFSDIYTSIVKSKGHVQEVRERLRECKNLLLLKRQEIRNLWFETSKENALAKIYQNIDELKHVPIRFQFYINKHLYLHASLLLIKAREHQELRLINALADIDLQLKEERSNFEEKLRTELINQLFDKPCRDILGNKNLSSTNSSLNKNDHNYLSRIRENRLLRKQLDQDFESGKLLFESHSIAIIPDKYILIDISHQSPEYYLEVLIQSLSLLSRLNKTLDDLQKQLHGQFHRIVQRTTQHIVDNNFVMHSNNSPTNNPDCLRDLLETCYEQFKIVVKNIEFLLNSLKLIQDHQAPVQIQQKEYIALQTAENQREIKSEQKQAIPTAFPFEIPYLFSMELVWETLQQVLSEVLNEYIEYNNTIDGLSSDSLSNSHSADYTNHHAAIDFSQYLTKKAPPRAQQIPRLFEFSQSAQFNSLTSYLQEQNRFVMKQETATTAITTTTYKQYVCKPNYRNITAVHDILQRIIEDIDANIKLHPTKRILDRKLTEFIRDRFIGRVIKDICESAQLTTTSSIADQNRLAELVPLVLQKQLQLPIPILQSTYLIFKSCEELCALVKCLPPYADDFCQAIIDLLFKHRESCNKLFLSIVERNDAPGTSIYSNEWVKDQDINRHLRTMPAFDAFIRAAKQQHSSSNHQDDNADNIRFRQTKETETLLINFSQNEMNLDDICTTYKHIKLLANIHESLDWLYCKLSYYFDILDKCLTDTKHLDVLTQTTVTSSYTSRSLKQNLHQYDQLKLSRVNLEIFSNAMKTTLTLSYDILLVLFLEIRLHCFYHLSLLFRNASHYASVIDTDPDENIMTLNRDLTRLQETLHSSLNENKFSFLFQGLGFVLATILIRAAPRFNRLSETGVTKMCRNIFAIEQTLTPIRAVGDAELMRAHRYYDLLLYTTKADEIIAFIEEHRHVYTEQDVLHLLQLKHRSFPASESGNFDLQKYEQLIKHAFHPNATAQNKMVNGQKNAKQ